MYDTRLHHKGASRERSFPSYGRLPLGEPRRYDAPLMSLLVSLATVAVLVAFWVRWERERERSLATVAALEERVRQLTMRLDVAEHDAVVASAHAEVAESVLLEKGYADADDLEAARLRLEREPVGGSRARGDELN